jgi:hypothetical protein
MAWLPAVHPQRIIASFLIGTSCWGLTAGSKLPFETIYKILQDHFRLLLPQFEQMIKDKDEEIAHLNGMLNDAEAQITDLRTEIQANELKISAWMTTAGQNAVLIDDMARECAGSVRRRDEQIEELLIAIDDFKHKEVQQESDIQTLATQLAMRQWPFYLLEIETPVTDGLAGEGNQEVTWVPTTEKQVLDMFYRTDDLSIVCSETQSSPEEIFRILRRRFRPADQGFLAGIEMPASWQLDRPALAETVRGSSFLFSLTVVDSVFGCRTTRDLVALLAKAFQDFSEFPERNWPLMAAVVVEMIAKNIVRPEPTAANLETQITTLKSLRGKLTRKFRTEKANHQREKAQLQKQIRDLRRHLSQLQAPGSHATGACAPDFPPILREMNEILTKTGPRRYSDHLYYAAVVVLFRSRSTYDFLRDLGFPFPAPNSVYEHFRPRLTESLNRLKSVDQVEPFLASLIKQNPEISDGAVLAVDAVACSSTFIGIKNIQHGDIHYLFVVLLQPLVPTARCCPLFVIESSQGVGNETIQAKIDEIVAIASPHLRRTFLGSDGDASYNERHHSFMDFWEPFYNQFGLERVLIELKEYPEVFPLSDLLHMAKNWRVRLLRFLLTFVLDRASTTIDHEKMLDILGRGPAFTDLTPLGKMRDAYPLAMMRLENMVALIEHDAIAEAVAMLPLSLTLNAVRLETIPPITRTLLLRTSFYLVRKLYELKQSGVDTNPETTNAEKNHRITIFLSPWSQRFMDTLLELILCIEEHPHIALDRVGTHPAETFFGTVRMDAHDVNTPDEMERSIAHTDIVTDAYRDLGLVVKVRNRISVGVRIGDTAPPAKIFDIKWPQGLTPDLIADICLKAVHMGPQAVSELLTDEDQVWFWQFVQILKDLTKAAEASATNNEINQRFISGSGSKIRTHLACT